MNLVRIDEFAKLTDLSLADLLSLLALGKLPFERGAQGELLIDITQLSDTDLAQRLHTRLSTYDLSPLEEEIVATEIVTILDQMLAEAMELAQNWWQARLAKPESDG